MLHDSQKCLIHLHNHFSGSVLFFFSRPAQTSPMFDNNSSEHSITHVGISRGNFFKLFQKYESLQVGNNQINKHPQNLEKSQGNFPSPRMIFTLFGAIFKLRWKLSTEIRSNGKQLFGFDNYRSSWPQFLGNFLRFGLIQVTSTPSNRFREFFLSRFEWNFFFAERVLNEVYRSIVFTRLKSFKVDRVLRRVISLSRNLLRLELWLCASVCLLLVLF